MRVAVLPHRAGAQGRSTGAVFGGASQKLEGRRGEVPYLREMNVLVTECECCCWRGSVTRVCDGWLQAEREGRQEPAAAAGGLPLPPIAATCLRYSLAASTWRRARAKGSSPPSPTAAAAAAPGAGTAP